jgi:hypothetical protein
MDDYEKHLKDDDDNDGDDDYDDDDDLSNTSL